MHLIIIHKPNHHSANNGNGLLRNALADELIADITFNKFEKTQRFKNNGRSMIAVPGKWQLKTLNSNKKIFSYNGNIPLSFIDEKQKNRPSWLILSDGRFVTDIDHQKIDTMLTDSQVDMITLNVDPLLLPYQEHVKITSQGNIAGFRRLYYDSAVPEHLPTDWPHHLFIKPAVLEKITKRHSLPLKFKDFADKIRTGSMTFNSYRIAGTVLDLQNEADLLKFLAAKMNSMPASSSLIDPSSNQSCKIADNARFFGRIALGKNVHIGQNSVIVGPTILSDNTKIAKKTVIKASVIGPEVSIPKNSSVCDRIILNRQSQNKVFSNNTDSNRTVSLNGDNNSIRSAKNFRQWPRFSYPACGKRIADFVLSLIVLVLFSPVLIIIALAIKLSSPGPVFFKHKREGLHAKPFFCLKFRTMIIGAEQIQEKLRSNNQVDGPQFKMKKDPRITTIGKFLRDTYIDEIPQFMNVLLGQMSIVGPRPSPKNENSLCPFWRDARLSVRPGITGLWQIYRTRRSGRDFQEWIYYDTKYVRELSLTSDLLLCFKTAKKIITNFLDQF